MVLLTPDNLNRCKLPQVIFLIIFTTSVSTVNSNLLSHSGSRNIQKSFDPFSNYSALQEFRNSGSEEFAIISPLEADDNSSGSVKRRRVIRRRSKVKSPASLVVPPTIIPPVDENLQLNDSNVSTFKTYSKTRFHNKIRDVWKIPNLTQEIFSDETDPKLSFLGKRESAELSQNGTSSTSSELEPPDLNTEESINPIINTSTPISNELQNSLQFTLQMLHPLFNSDSVLSEKSPKIPEDKNIGLTHSLSGSFAQTPIAHDLGFLPSNLRKQHPLLNPDSILTSEDGASKTGPRTHIHPIRNHSTYHIEDLISTADINDTHNVSESKLNEDGYNSQTTSTTKPWTITVSSGNKIVPANHPVDSVTVTPEMKAELTTEITEVTIPQTTRFQPSSTLSTTDLPSIEPDVLGVLNITEIVTSSESHSDVDYKTPTKRPENFLPIPELDEYNNHPPVIMFPLDDDKPSSTTASSTTVRVPETSVPISPASSVVTSSAEQLLVEQLLGLGGPAISPSSDSNELAQLFNLIQSQQSKRAPVPQNVQPLSPTTNNNNPTQELQNLLQAFLQPQLKPPNPGSQPQFDLATLLNLGLGSKISTLAPSQLSPPSQNDGLSDSDLKSIFALLDNQASTSTTTTIRTTTTTPTTTTSTTTTTPRPVTTASPSQITTTLHPALQSMLDLFQNQLKPFQNIQTQPTSDLSKNFNPISPQQVNPEREKIPNAPVAVQPATTPNSLDILSQLLNFGSLAGSNKVNPVRATPAPEFSLASIFNNQNIFPSNFPSPAVPASQATAPSESNQLFNFFGEQPSYHSTTPPPPNGLYYWLDLNAFLGGDPKADPMSGIRPKIGSRYPFLKVKR